MTDQVDRRQGALECEWELGSAWACLGRAAGHARELGWGGPSLIILELQEAVFDLQHVIVTDVEAELRARGDGDP